MSQNTRGPLPTIVLPRVVLVPFTHDHIPVASTYRSDPRVAYYQGWGPSLAPDRFARHLTEVIHDRMVDGRWGGMFAIHERSTGAHIGDCVACEDRNKPLGSTHGWVAYNLMPSQWGKGYATEVLAALLDFAFRTEGAEMMEGVVFGNNVRSARVLQKNGFVLGGEEMADMWGPDVPRRPRYEMKRTFQLSRAQWLSNRGGA